MPEKRSRKQSKGGSDSKRIDNESSQEQSEDVWSRPNWPPRLEKIFVELLIEEMNYHLDVCVSGFGEEAWDRVCKEFNEETSLNYDKMELKKHLAILRKRYRIVKPLYNHGGFGWDYRRKMVDVDDGIWAEYIQAYPEIKPYRKWGCPIYEELCTIFTKPKATGRYVYASTGRWRGSGSNDLPRSSTGSVNSSHGCNKRQAAEPLGSGPNKKQHHKGAENSKGTASFETDDPHSVTHCITIINGMQGVDRRTYNAALDLFQNPIWRKTFMSLKSEKRLTWLKAMLPSVP